MKVGYTVGIVIGMILAIVLAVTTILPEELERSTTERLCAPRTEVFTLFNDLEQVMTWATLFQSEEGADLQFDGRSGSGASVKKIDRDERWLALQITDSDPLERVNYHFFTHNDFNTYIEARFETLDEGTQVQLSMRQAFGTLWGRWAVLFAGGALEELMKEEFGSLTTRLSDDGYECEAQAD